MVCCVVSLNIFETMPLKYFTTFAFHLKEAFVTKPLWKATIYVFIFIHNIYCFQTLGISACALNFYFFLAISLSIYSLCRFTYWLWKPCFNSSLLWRGSPYLLLLSLCLWGLAAAHWRSYMTVKRAINAGSEAEVYGCFSLP